MKIMNFGSLNIDKVYSVTDFVQPGQTILARSYQTFAGGKGLNQSIAAARAGATVLHAGAIGAEGGFLTELLRAAGADTSRVQVLDAPSGHAMIEVSSTGQNRIIVYGGTNQMLTESYIDEVLSDSAPGDLVLLQNETNLIDIIIRKAHARGLRIVYNPSPMPDDIASLPLDLVNCLMVNEIEAAQVAGIDVDTPYEQTLDVLTARYPDASIVMTVGHNGVRFAQGTYRTSQPAFSVDAVDTTAAGDTFCGYFLSALCRNADTATALREASAAAAIAVSRPGAAPSIPTYAEVQEFLTNR